MDHYVRAEALNRSFKSDILMILGMSSNAKVESVEGQESDWKNLYDWVVDGVRVQIKGNHGSKVPGVWGTFTIRERHYLKLKELYENRLDMPEFHVEYGCQNDQIVAIARIRVLDLLEYIDRDFPRASVSREEKAGRIELQSRRLFHCTVIISHAHTFRT